jgi:CO/xanthine dehydrogenase FAD-binding subunit
VGSVLDEQSLARVAREVAAALTDVPADTRGSAEYRTEMAGVAAARALGEAWRRAV